MESTFKCYHCGGANPIQQDLVGQYVLCRYCATRILMTEATAAEKAKSAESDWDSLIPPPVPAARLGGMRQRTEASALPLGLIVTVGVAALLFGGGFVVWAVKPSREVDPQVGPRAAQVASSLPPPPPTVIAPAEVQEPEEAASSAPTEAVPQQPEKSEAKSQPMQPRPDRASQGQPGLPGSPPLAQPPAASSRWAEVWRLPPASSSGTEVLASVGDAQTPWNITLNPAATGSGSRLIVEQDSEQGAWTLSSMSYSQPTTAKAPLALLRRDSSNLLFAWATPPSEPQARHQMLNSLLEIRDATRKRVAVGQLREPVRLQPIALDLATDKQIVEAQIEDPPRVGVQLEICELSGFSSEAKLKTAIARSPLTLAPMSLAPQPQVIEFSDIPGLEIRIRFVAEPAGKLTISIDPAFLENQSEIDVWSPRQLDRLEEEAKKSLRDAQTRLADAEKSLKRKQDLVSKLQANPPSALDRKRKAAWDRELREEGRWVATFTTEVNAQNKKIEASQARLVAVPKLRSFLKESHKQATIHYVVYMECGETDLLLVDGRGEY